MRQYLFERNVFRSPYLLCIAIPVLLATSSLAMGETEAPSAQALLRGARLARLKHEAMATEFDIKSISGGRQADRKCVVDLDREKLRFEILQGKTSKAQVIIRNGSEFQGYYRGDQNDVALYDLAYAVQSRGDFAFDPRILGIDGTMLANATVEGSIRLPEPEMVRVVGKEAINGVSTWRVSMTSDNSAKVDYWIEEPLFRVHRVLVQASDRLQITIDSKFDVSDKVSPFPNEVKIRRQAGERITEKVCSVRSIDLSPMFASGRFSLESMDLPINTSVIDYRKKLVVGYWNGERVVDNPVGGSGDESARQSSDGRSGPTAEPKASPTTGLISRQWLLIMANAFALVVLLLFLWRSKK